MSAVPPMPPCSRAPFAPLRVLSKKMAELGRCDRTYLARLPGVVLRHVALEPVRQLERALYDEQICAHALPQPPLFILGHWRSGTTSLQQLFQADPNMCTSTLFTSLFGDTFYLAESTLKPALNWVSKALGLQLHIQRMPMDWDLPAEADVGLLALSSEFSYTWGNLFPKAFLGELEQLAISPRDFDAAQWLAHLDYFIRKLSLRHQGRRVVVKSPGDTARVAHLIRQYPDAKFVYVHRNPLDVFHSTRFLWAQIDRQLSLQQQSQEAVDRMILEGYKKVVGSYLAQRGDIPPAQLVEIDFDDLVHDTVSTLREAYRHLQLGPFPEAQLARVVAQQGQAQKAPKRTTHDAIDDVVRGEWAFAFHAWPGAARKANVPKSAQR